MKDTERPFYLNRCYYKTSGIVLFLTGPFYYARMAQEALNQEGYQDVVLSNPSFTNVSDNFLQTIDLNGDSKTINFNINIK